MRDKNRDNLRHGRTSLGAYILVQGTISIKTDRATAFGNEAMTPVQEEVLLRHIRGEEDNAQFEAALNEDESFSENCSDVDFIDVPDNYLNDER